MKKFLKSTPVLVFAATLVWASMVLFAPRSMSQGTAFGNGRGAFRGDVYVPSVFNLWFGDNTSTDVNMQKNGAGNIGIGGHLGALGSTANTTTTPSSAFAAGTVTLSSNTATVTFKVAFVATPVCVATDVTTAQLVKSAPTTTTVVLSDTVGATDVIQYICVGNPN